MPAAHPRGQPPRDQLLFIRTVDPVYDLDQHIEMTTERRSLMWLACAIVVCLLYWAKMTHVDSGVPIAEHWFMESIGTPRNVAQRDELLRPFITPGQSRYAHDDLLAAYKTLEPWPSSTNMTADGRLRAKRVAEMVQESDPRVVAASLDDFIRYAVSTHDEDLSRRHFRGYVEETKVYLMLRVAFELPEHGLKPYKPHWGVFAPSSPVNQDGTVNHAWPIKWNAGIPALVVGAYDFEGFYDAAAEYMYFLRNYPFRKLSAMKP